MVSARATCILAASLLLAAAPACAADAPAVALGKNLAGETCQLSAPKGDSRSIVCAGADTPAGDIRIVPQAQPLPAAIDARHAALASILEGGAENEGESVSCDPQWLGGDDVLLVCTFQSDGWPHLIMGSMRGGKLYRASGLPSSLPLLEAAIASASGTPMPAPETSAAMQAAQAKLSAEALRVGAADYSGYSKDVEAARLQSGADDYAAAESSYRKALAIETKLFGENSVIVGQTLAELALQVSNQGRFDEAQGLFQRATPIIQASSSNAARARLLSYEALDAANRRDYANALKFAQQATAIRRADVDQSKSVSTASGGGPELPANEGELAHSLRIEADMALRLGDLPSARAAAEEASLIVSQEPGLPLWWRPAVVSLMGEINEREGRVVAAEHAFIAARDLDVKLFGDNAPTVLADLRLGQFYSGQQLYGPALDAYNAAFVIMAKDQVSRAIIVPDQIVPYIAAASATPGHDAELFRASQYANSSVADQTIALVAAREAAGNSALSGLIRQAQDAARMRDDARMELAAEFAKPDDARSGAHEQTLQASVQASSARADSLLAQVKQQFPQYASLSNPGPAELKDVQAALGPREAMIVFVIGVNDSYGLLVTRDGLDVRHLKIGQADLDDDVADLRKAFMPALGRLPQFSLKTSNDLYQALLAPFEAKLAGVDSLIVVPNGSLANLPLSLLVTEPPAGDGNDYAQAAWLVRRMAVSNMPSPRAFLSLRDEREHHAPAPRGFLGVANPAYAGSSGAAGAKALSALAVSCREEGPIDPALLRALPPLPETAGEVQTVAAHLGGGNPTILSGGNATEPALRAQALDQYAVVYFATHGILPGELHCAGEPGLALSPPSRPASSTASDGLLTASEIAQLRLNADLVVLSACNTAESGSANGGGSLEGLADSFFAAGARAVLASHWQVPSGATEHLMVGVFDRTGRGGSDLAQALRQSQLQLISQPATAHPFNWAAFTIIGDGETLAPANVQSAKAGE